MDIYQETALLLFRKPPETLLNFEPWVFLKEAMLEEILRENSCRAWTVEVLCSDFLLTFGFLTVHVKAWLQVLLRKHVPSSGKPAWCWGRRSSFVKVAACSEPEQDVQAVWREQHEWMCQWDMDGAGLVLPAWPGLLLLLLLLGAECNLPLREKTEKYRNHTLEFFLYLLRTSIQNWLAFMSSSDVPFLF